MSQESFRQAQLYTPTDVLREGEAHRSAMDTAEAQRQAWAHKQMMDKVEAAQTAAATAAAQKRSDEFMKALRGEAPPTTPGASGAAQEAPGASPEGEITPETTSAAPGEPQTAAPAQKEPPMVTWFKANPVIAQQYAGMMQTGDGEGMRKILQMYHESPEGTKAQKIDQAKRAAGEIGLIPGTAGHRKYLEEYTLGREPAGTTFNLPAQEKAFESSEGADVQNLWNGYRQAALEAPGRLTHNNEMYSSALRAEETGALVELRIGVRKLARAFGLDDPEHGAPELWNDLTGIEGASIQEYERLQQQTMDLVMQRISQTKGAISEREMEAFKNSVAGLRNTPMGNLLILEYSRRVEEGNVERGDFFRDYFRKHGKSSSTTEDAAFAWAKHMEEGADQRAAEVEQRRDAMKSMGANGPRALRRLMERKHNPKVVKDFYQAYGWLPLGFDETTGKNRYR